MSTIRQYGIVILVVLPVAIVVLIRALSSDRFDHNARKLAGSSFTHSNIVAWHQLDSLARDYLILDLDDRGDLEVKHLEYRVIRLPADSVLEKPGRDILRKHGKPFLLYSSDPAVPAKVWMLLSQMGYRNIYILSREADPEVMKYKFRPDTLQTGAAL